MKRESVMCMDEYCDSFSKNLASVRTLLESESSTTLVERERESASFSLSHRSQKLDSRLWSLLWSYNCFFEILEECTVQNAKTDDWQYPYRAPLSIFPTTLFASISSALLSLYSDNDVRQHRNIPSDYIVHSFYTTTRIQLNNQRHPTTRKDST